MSEKPEWFQLTDGDQKPEPEAKRASKRFVKIAAFTAPLLLVGGAMVFADGEESDDRPNINTTLSSGTGTTASVSSDEHPTESAPAVQISNPKTAAVNAPSAASPSSIASKGPGIQAPSGQGGDDHDGFSGEREHREGGEREHHDRERNGTAPTIPQSGTSTTKN